MIDIEEEIRRVKKNDYLLRTRAAKIFMRDLRGSQRSPNLFDLKQLAAQRFALMDAGIYPEKMLNNANL